jgi:putative SOS response-associated peptidase YedK
LHATIVRVCGRYTLTTVDGPALAQRFGLLAPAGLEAATLGRFNVCPTEPVAAVCVGGGARAARALRWGLVPRWAHALGAGPEPINARAESVAERRPFAALLPRADRRCLVPADGWYEWLRPERRGGDRVPFRYTVDGGAPFAFAGLWDVGRIGGEPVASMTILTTAANALCAPVHDRMPCVLAGPDEEAAWLDADALPHDLAELLAPLASARTDAAPADPAVNRAGTEGPRLLEPPGSAPEPAQLSLGI